MSQDGRGGVFSDAYVYEQLADQNSLTRKLFSAVGSAVGRDLGGNLGSVLGKQLGGGLGFYVENASVIGHNVMVFGAELNDWRSWHAVMSEMAGPSFWR